MLRLRGGGGAPVRAGFGGGSDARGPFKKLRALVPGTPEGGPKRPPGPGSAWGLVRGHVGGVQRRPRPNSRRGGDISPPDGENGRPGRPHAATALDGRPARAWPAGQGPSPRPFPAARSSPLRSCARLGPQGFWGREAPSFAPEEGRSPGPRFGASIRRSGFGAPLRGLPPSPPPLEGTGAWQGPPSGRGGRAGAALPRWARETVWRGGKKGRGRGPRAGTPLFSEG